MTKREPSFAISSSYSIGGHQQTDKLRLKSSKFGYLVSTLMLNLQPRCPPVYLPLEDQQASTQRPAPAATPASTCSERYQLHHTPSSCCKDRIDSAMGDIQNLSSFGELKSVVVSIYTGVCLSVLSILFVFRRSSSSSQTSSSSSAACCLVIYYCSSWSLLLWWQAFQQQPAATPAPRSTHQSAALGGRR